MMYNKKINLMDKNDINILAEVLATAFAGFFFRGPKSAYKETNTHKDKLYFATDTLELFLNGKSYSGGKQESVYCGDFSGTTLNLYDYKDYDVVCLRLTSSSTGTFTIDINDLFANAMTAGGIAYADRSKSYKKLLLHLYVPYNSFSNLNMFPNKTGASGVGYPWGNAQNGIKTVTIDGAYNVATNMGSDCAVPSLRKSMTIEITGYRPGNTNFIAILAR